MAHIHPFPVVHDMHAIRQLSSQLEAAIATGEDLGPRGHQIFALGRSLEHASDRLREKSQEILSDLTNDHSEMDDLRALLLRWVDDLTSLADSFAHLGRVAQATGSQPAVSKHSMPG